MADRIKVSTEEIQRAISKYDNAQDTLNDAFSKLQGAKEHLDRCYKGPDYAVLAAKYVDTYMNIKTAEKAITETVNALKQAAGVFDETESTIASEAGSLEAGSSAPTYMG